MGGWVVLSLNPSSPAAEFSGGVAEVGGSWGARQTDLALQVGMLLLSRFSGV